ncbi:SDR family NAD(P)-dependent oxidoreductase [Promicromonospora sp. NPDC050262]|uniref:SDR family NAD(P)-dependent oxidoreductase n=1 Tax=Promicromonospora sp. NPDC050262 TaxID=3155036 RepID=UPI0033FD1B07
MSELLQTPFGASATADDVLTDVDLAGKRFVVTGGASGIGAQTTLALARRGGEVTIGVRDPGAARTWLASVGPVAGQIDVAYLDLADLNSVEQFTAGWSGALDGLIGNAGIMALPRRQVSGAGWEMQLATNYLGHFKTALGLHVPLARAGGRVVLVSSAAHLRAGVDFTDPQYERRDYDRWNAYSQSKSADVLLAVGISRRWDGDGITANALMPGWITTRLQRHLDDDTLRAMGAMDDEGNRIDQSYFKSTAQGAATSVLLAASPLTADVTGKYFEDNQEAPVVETGEGHATGVARHAIDPANADRLWELGASALAR